MSEPLNTSTWTATGLANARERGLPAAAVAVLTYPEMVNLCGVVVDERCRHGAAWSYESARREIARVLEADAALAEYDREFDDLAFYFGEEAAARQLGERPQEASL